jgi:hypothetical protein
MHLTRVEPEVARLFHVVLLTREKFLNHRGLARFLQ